jgi:succinyl-CoA synthetase beta subunit
LGAGAAMDLLEYQAKALFRQVGIPVLPSQQIHDVQDCKNLKIPYPMVLKSQVRAGGRANAGGIRFVENTIDAIATAQALFKLPIDGEYPEVLLAEAKYNSERELYLAMVIDPTVCRPVLLGSAQGGVGVESALDCIQKVMIDQEFSPYYARQLASKMGLSGRVFQSVSAIIEKLGQLFFENDLDLIEINPLAVSLTGDVMALDGKVTVHDAALGRHPNLAGLVPSLLTSFKGKRRSPLFPNLETFDGHIGLLCNGTGLTMSTLDILYRVGGQPSQVLNIGGDYRHSWSPATLLEQIERGLVVLSQNPNVSLIFVNIIGNAVPCTQIAATMARYLRLKAPNPAPKLVIRLVGHQINQAQDMLSEFEVPIYSDLKPAIAQAMALMQPEPAKSSA